MARRPSKSESVFVRHELRPRFLFLLQPEFPMNAFILATETLRIANQNSGRRLFEWLLASETGQPVRASNGMWIDVGHAIATLPRADFVLLFEGNLPTQRNSQRLLAALRNARRHGAFLIAIDTAAFALAQAGLTDEEGTVLHWEAARAFAERFPEIEIRNQIYRLGEGLGFAAGGVATLDLMLDIIAKLRGRALANEVANALVHSPRLAEAPQRTDDSQGSDKPSLSRRIVSLMERNLDFPLTPAEIARRLGLSARSLERRCRLHFSQTPMKLYLRIRLQAARNLLFYEELDVKEISDACGFSYPSVFTRAFTTQFGQTPRQFRASFRASQREPVRPEILRLSASGDR